MSRELEIEIEDDVCHWAEARGWLVRKMIYPNRRGCPDRWFFKEGRVVIIEFKRPKGRLSGNQKMEIARFTEHGFHVHVINSRDTACMILEGEPYSHE